MSITTRIGRFLRQKLVPTTAKPAAPAAIRTFPLVQLTNLTESDFRLGPLTCRQWDTHFIACFTKYQQRSAHFNEFFPDPDAFLAAGKVVIDSNTSARGKQISSLCSEFSAGFFRHAAKALGTEIEKVTPANRAAHDVLFASSYAYLRLLKLALKVAQAKRAGNPTNELIENANKFFTKLQGIAFRVVA
ncbi:MAG: hypothetical protein JW873_04150 [Candidatus Saganbacteria bacterium]|nr:hypothetical protein [Candidatus Saganbacteria bacterium]